MVVSVEAVAIRVYAEVPWWHWTCVKVSNGIFEGQRFPAIDSWFVEPEVRWVASFVIVASEKSAKTKSYTTVEEVVAASQSVGKPT